MMNKFALRGKFREITKTCFCMYHSVPESPFEHKHEEISVDENDVEIVLENFEAGISPSFRDEEFHIGTVETSDDYFSVKHFQKFFWENKNIQRMQLTFLLALCLLFWLKKRHEKLFERLIGRGPDANETNDSSKTIPALLVCGSNSGTPTCSANNDTPSHAFVCFTESSSLGGTIDEVNKKLSECGNLSSKCRGEDIVVIMGGTKTGKSVLANYLCGLKFVPKPAFQNAAGGWSQNDKVELAPGQEPLTEIGQKNDSMTPYPIIIPHRQKGLVFCDFPGFFDSKGLPSILANVANMCKVVNSAKSVKFLIVWDYSSIKQGKSFHLLLDEIDLIDSHLGNRFLNLLESVVIMITKTNNEDISVEDVRATFEESLRDTEKHGRYRVLSEKIMIYDPVDDRHHKYRKSRKQRSKREDILAKIRSLSNIPLTTPNFFGATLPGKTEGELSDLIDETLKKMNDGLQSIGINNYESKCVSVKNFVHQAKELRKMCPGHLKIQEMEKKMIQEMRNHFTKVVRNVTRNVDEDDQPTGQKKPDKRDVGMYCLQRLILKDIFDFRVTDDDLSAFIGNYYTSQTWFGFSYPWIPFTRRWIAPLAITGGGLYVTNTVCVGSGINRNFNQVFQSIKSTVESKYGFNPNGALVNVGSVVGKLGLLVGMYFLVQMVMVNYTRRFDCEELFEMIQGKYTTKEDIIRFSGLRKEFY